ncbi:hypothetical protein [Porticoccus sp.]|uniref:hypothetical protein n=1 Tax=Porticoccus sp. TaxID=2024853 RepID=UPI0039E31C5B
MLYCIFIAAVIILLLWLPGIRVKLETADEGYLCFGAQQYARGKIPIRDFRAYDPGRYLWVGLFMKLLGQTFHTQRLAMSLVMIATLSTGGWLIYQISHNWYATALSQVLLYLWLHPYYKSFEVLTCLLTIASGYLLLNDPGGKTLLYAGIIHGLAYFLGLNLGLYASAAFLVICLICLISGQLDFLVTGGVFTVGTMIGLMPLLYIAARYSGFANAYWHEKVLTILKRGTTNLSLPLPFWGRPTPHWTRQPRAKRILFKTLFNALPLIYITGMVVGLVQIDRSPNLSALIISGSTVGMAYFHHLYSRCDFDHLCMSIHPCLITIVALSALLFSSAIILPVLALLTASSILLNNKNLQNSARRLIKPKSDVKLALNNEFFLLPPPQANMLEQMNKFINTCSNSDEKCFFAPSIPGFYALYNRDPAAYDTYCVYPAGPEKQQKMIQELMTNRTKLAIIFDVLLDGRDDLRFSRTHPDVYDYLRQNFASRCYENIPDHIKIFTRH